VRLGPAPGTGHLTDARVGVRDGSKIHATVRRYKGDDIYGSVGLIPQYYKSERLKAAPVN